MSTALPAASRDMMAGQPEPPSLRRWPIIPTIIVALAVLTMLALGAWQWQRAGEKRALLDLYAANQGMSDEIALPAMGPVPDAAMFRAGRALCMEVIGWRAVGGRSVSGVSGYRQLAQCRTGAEGPGFIADMGVTEDASYQPQWAGGIVSGIVTHEPVAGGLWASLTRTAPVPRAMLVSRTALPGLQPTAPPDPSSLPNNHIAYAGQWVFFALAAIVIYVLAVRHRWRQAEAAAHKGDEHPAG